MSHSADVEDTTDREKLDPIPNEAQIWTERDFVSLWLTITCNLHGSMAIGGSLLQIGVDGGPAVVVVIGKGITMLALWGHAAPGPEYGIPFPLFARLSFGIRGSQAVPEY